MAENRMNDIRASELIATNPTQTNLRKIQSNISEVNRFQNRPDIQKLKPISKEFSMVESPSMQNQLKGSQLLAFSNGLFS